MAVKYACPKCNKRFIDWGAEKLNFKCPDCTDEALVLVGHESSQSRSSKRPSLKRAKRSSVKKKTPVLVPVAEEALDGAVLNDGADVDITDSPPDLLYGGQDTDPEPIDDTDGPPLVEESAKAKSTKEKVAKSKSGTAKAKPKAKPKAKSKAKPKAKPKAKSKAKPKAKSKAKPKAKPKAKSKAKPKAKPKAKEKAKK